MGTRVVCAEHRYQFGGRLLSRLLGPLGEAFQCSLSFVKRINVAAKFDFERHPSSLASDARLVDPVRGLGRLRRGHRDTISDKNGIL